MDAGGIDHVTLCIPDDGIEEAVEFYGETLGFDIEGIDDYKLDIRDVILVRLGPDSALNLRPTSSFEAPGGADHVAVRVGADVETVRARLEEAGVGIETEYKSHLGASGRGPTVAVEDPFGYRLELRATARP